MDNKENKSGRPLKSEKTSFTGIFRELVGTATQQEIADKIGTSRQNVGKWLSGATSPDMTALRKIANAYNVSADYLLGLTNIKSTECNVKTVCEYTGLSEKTCNFFHNLQSFATGQKTTTAYIEEKKKLEDTKKALEELYKEHPEVKQHLNEYLNERPYNNEDRIAFAQKHQLYETAFEYESELWTGPETLKYLFDAPLEEAKNILSAINKLLSSEKVYDLLHLLVVFFNTDFAKDKGNNESIALSGTITNDNDDSGGFFTLSPQIMENGILLEILSIIKSLKNSNEAIYYFTDIERECIRWDNCDYDCILPRNELLEDIKKEEKIPKEGDPNAHNNPPQE